MRKNIRNCVRFQEERELISKATSSEWKSDSYINGVLHQKDIREHTGCVNSVELNKSEDFLASGGDDQRVIIWKMTDLLGAKKPKPLSIMSAKHRSNIFAHAFSLDDKTLYSGGNDGAVLKHDIETGKLCHKYLDYYAVYNIDANPIDLHSFGAACAIDVILLDSRAPETTNVSHDPSTSFYAASFNPTHAPLLLVAASVKGVLVYDLRNTTKPLIDSKKLSSAGDETTKSNVVFARWNSTGSGFAVLQSGSYPYYYDLVNNTVVNFCDKLYNNEQTLKSIDFINDDTIATGSDSFKIFIWKIPNVENDEREKNVKSRSVESATRILYGHRSVVNHIRYSSINETLISSGVEKMIKCWSKYSIPGSYEKPYTREPELRRRARISRREEEPREGDDDGTATFDDVFGGSHETSEDVNMLRYFDSLVLRSGEISLRENLTDYINDEEEEEEDDDYFDNEFDVDEVDEDEDDLEENEADDEFEDSDGETRGSDILDGALDEDIADLISALPGGSAENERNLPNDEYESGDDDCVQPIRSWPPEN